jgi:hypothetical protein
MPLVNPNIAMSFRPTTELQIPNALAQYAQVQQIMGGQQAQDLNQLKIQEYERERADDARLSNYLAKSDLSTPEGRAGLIKFGKTGLAYGKALSEQDTAKLTQQKTQFELQKAKKEFISQAQRDTSQNPSDANITAFKEDLMANPLFTEAEKTRMVAGADRILSMPVSERSAFMASQGASASELKPSVQQINQGGQTQMLRVPAFGGAPTTVGTYEDVPLPAAVQAQNLQRAVAAKPVTNITNVAEKAEAGEFGKLLVSEFSDLSKTANLAIKTLPSIDANLNILDKGFATGFGTETKAAGAKVLAALGVPDAEKFATNAQIFQAKANEAVLQKQLEQKGPQTQSDRELIQTTGAQLGTTTQGNKFLLTVAKEQLKRDIEQRDFYRKWRQSTGSFNGAEDAWFAGEGSKSLFDRPGLKQYLAPTSAASQIPGQGPTTPAARPPAANVVTNPQFPGFSIGK